MTAEKFLGTRHMNKIERVSYIFLRLGPEHIQPDDSDMPLLRAYIDSKISLSDLLGHARQFGTEEHYREWMHNAAQVYGDFM